MKVTQPNEKWAKYMSDEFTNKKTQMASKHIKIWLTSQLTKGIQIETTVWSLSYLSNC